jgi:predicted AAA+ superfamily ATPase
VIHLCYHSSCSGLPLVSQKDESVFKLYFLDIGLLNYLRGATWDQLQSYRNDQLLIKGEIAEQFAAQHLAYRDQGLEEPSLLYWLRDKKLNNAEVDFVVEWKGQILPVEIKAGKSGRLQSAKQFAQEKNCGIICRFDLSEHSESVEKLKLNNQGVVNLANHHLGLVGFFFDQSRGSL